MFSAKGGPLVGPEWEVDVLLLWLQPTAHSEARRELVFDRIRSILTQSPTLKGAGVFLTGSFPTKTYLPDADLDIALFLPPANETDEAHRTTRVDSIHRWVCEVNSALCQAGLDQSQADAAAVDTSLQIRNVAFVNGRVKVVNCLVGNISVDVCCARSPALAAALLIEEVSRLQLPLLPRPFASTTTVKLPQPNKTLAEVVSSGPQQAPHPPPHRRQGAPFCTAPSSRESSPRPLQQKLVQSSVPTNTSRSRQQRATPPSRQHLVKRSLLLVKAWSLYESGSLVAALAPWFGAIPVLCSRGGRLSTYAVNTMVLSLFNETEQERTAYRQAIAERLGNLSTTSSGATSIATAVAADTVVDGLENVECSSGCQNTNAHRDQPFSEKRRDRSNSGGSNSGGSNSGGNSDVDREHRNSRTQKTARSRSGSWEQEETAQAAQIAARVSASLGELLSSELQHPLLVLLRFFTVFSSFDWERFALTVDGALERNPNDDTPSRSSTPLQPPHLLVQVPLWRSGRPDTPTFFPLSPTAATQASNVTRPVEEALAKVRSLLTKTAPPTNKTPSSTTPSPTRKQQQPHASSPVLLSSPAPMVVVDPLDLGNNLAVGIGVHGCRAISAALELGRQRLEAFLSAQLHQHHSVIAAATAAAAAAAAEAAAAAAAATTGSLAAEQSAVSTTKTPATMPTTAAEVKRKSSSASAAAAAAAAAAASVALTGKHRGRPPRHPPSQHAAASRPQKSGGEQTGVGIGRDQKDSIRNGHGSARKISINHQEETLTTSLDFLRHMFPVTLAAYGQVPKVQASEDSSSSYPVLKRPVTIVDFPLTRRRRCGNGKEPQHGQQQQQHTSQRQGRPRNASNDRKVSSPASLPPPPLAIPLEALNPFAAFEIERRITDRNVPGMTKDEVATSSRSTDSPSSSSSSSSSYKVPISPPAHLSSLSPSAKVSPQFSGSEVPQSADTTYLRSALGNRLYALVNALVGPGLAIGSHTVATVKEGGAVKNGKRERHSNVSGSEASISRLAGPPHLPQRHVVAPIQKLVGELSARFLTSGDTECGLAPSTLAGKVTGMLLECEAIKTEDLLELLESPSLDFGEGSSSHREGGTAGVDTGTNSLNLARLVCQALEALDSHTAQPQQQQQHEGSHGGYKSGRSKNVKLDKKKHVVFQRTTVSKAVLMVEGNGFRSDLMDHPMQQYVPFSARGLGVMYPRDKNGRRRQIVNAGDEEEHEESDDDLEPFLKEGVGEFGYDVTGMCLEGNLVSMMQSLRRVSQPSVLSNLSAASTLATASIKSASPPSPPPPPSSSSSSSSSSSKESLSLPSVPVEFPADPLAHAPATECLPQELSSLSSSSPAQIYEQHGAFEEASTPSASSTSRPSRFDKEEGVFRGRRKVSPHVSEKTNVLAATSFRQHSSCGGQLECPNKWEAASARKKILDLENETALVINKPVSAVSTSGSHDDTDSSSSGGAVGKHKRKGRGNKVSSAVAAVTNEEPLVESVVAGDGHVTTNVPTRPIALVSTDFSTRLPSFFSTIGTRRAVAVLATLVLFPVSLLFILGAAGALSCAEIHSNGGASNSTILCQCVSFDWRPYKSRVYDSGATSSGHSSLPLGRRTTLHSSAAVGVKSTPGDNSEALETAAAGTLMKTHHSAATTAASSRRSVHSSAATPIYNHPGRLSSVFSPSVATAANSDGDNGGADDAAMPSWSLQRSTSIVFSSPPPSSSSSHPAASRPLLPPLFNVNQPPPSQSQQQHQHWVISGGSVLLGDLNGFGLKEESVNQSPEDERREKAEPSAAKNAHNKKAVPSLSGWNFLWQKNGDVLHGETQSFIAISKAASKDAGVYSCFVRRISAAEARVGVSSKDSKGRGDRKGGIEVGVGASTETLRSDSSHGEAQKGSFGAFGVVPLFSALLRVASAPAVPSGVLVQRALSVGGTLELEVPFPGVSGFPLPLCLWSFQGFPLQEDSMFKGGYVTASGTGLASVVGAKAAGEEPAASGQGSRHRGTFEGGGGPAEEGEEGGGAYGARLRVANMSRALAGTYTCDCTNEVGTVRWTEALVDVLGADNDRDNRGAFKEKSSTSSFAKNTATAKHQHRQQGGQQRTPPQEVRGSQLEQQQTKSPAPGARSAQTKVDSERPPAAPTRAFSDTQKAGIKASAEDKRRGKTRSVDDTQRATNEVTASRNEVAHSKILNSKNGRIRQKKKRKAKRIQIPLE